VHALLMGKGLLVSKKVVSIQFCRNNRLQGNTLNALICSIILNNNSSNNKKPKRKKKCEQKKTPTSITLALHSFWHCDGLKCSSHILLTPKLLKSQCLAQSY
jgi:hypothetical protein